MIDVYGLIGDSIQHSLSPIIHNFLFKKYNINADYRFFEVNDLYQIVGEIDRNNIKGVNVTKPFKIEIVDFLNDLSREAEKIGSVNTIVKKNGDLIGHNTDGVGAKNALNRFIELDGKNVLQLGAGGAGKAIAFELSKYSNVVVLNRTEKKAKKLKRFSIKGLELNKENLQSYLKWCDILINTSSVGMGSDNSLVYSNDLSEDILVFDIVYTPLKTRLLSEAENSGCKTIDGLWMLIYQALESFELWTGIRPDPDCIRDKVMEVIDERNSL